MTRRAAGWRSAGLSPATGAAVMGTGILSTATQAAGLPGLSRVLLGLAVLAEVALGAALVGRLLTDRAGWVVDAGTPASLTGVAATAVLGSRLADLGWTDVAWGSLAAATLLWLVLLPLVLRRWRVPTVGAGFLVCVATEGLAVLAGTLGGLTGRRPLLAAGLVACVLGVALYGLVLARFDWHQLATGAGDQWVLAGALAITSLAVARLEVAGERLGGPALPGFVREADLAVWAVAVAGYAVLAGCELRWPRPGYDVRRWATVFPMGMTAAATFAVARAAPLPALLPLGHLLLWPALVVWALTAAGAVRGLRAVR